MIFKEFVKSKDFLYFIGALLSTGMSILFGYILESTIIILYSVLGSFSYCFLNFTSLKKDLKNITLHGFFMILFYNVGIINSFYILMVPFILSLVFILCYLGVEIYGIANPKYFYIILMYATGLKGIEQFQNFSYIMYNLYIISGIVFSLVVSILIYSFFDIKKYRKDKLGDNHFWTLKFVDKLYYNISKKPKLFIIAIHGAFTFFIIGYLVYLFQIKDSIWIIISCAAVISADEIFLIRKKFIERILGSFIGVTIGFIIISATLPMNTLLVILLVMNGMFELFIKRNYLIANVFTNPLVLILSTFSSTNLPVDLAFHRILFLFIGGVIGYVSMFIFYRSLDHVYLYK